MSKRQKTLAEVLREARAERGMTQKQVAERCGMKNVTHYAKLEGGRTPSPRRDLLARLAKVLKVSAEAILNAA